MLEVRSTQPLDAVETALRQAAQAHGAAIQAVHHFGIPNLRTFALFQPEICGPLLAAEPRFAVFLPSHIAIRQVGAEDVCLEAASPVELCPLIDRPDLEMLALPLEKVIRRVMEAAGRANAMAAAGGQGAGHWAIGATEDQVNMRGALPQRIDRHGSKLEDLAGTGTHDSSGG